MEKNSDKRIVVMDIEMFARLMAYADIGEFEAGQVTGSSMAEIKRHVNKQNTFLGQARTRTATEEGKARKELSKQLKRKAQFIGMRESVKFWYIESSSNRLIAATLRKNGQHRTQFHNWNQPSVSIEVLLHYPDVSVPVATRVRVSDFVCDYYDNEYIANLINNEGFVLEENHAQENKI